MSFLAVSVLDPIATPIGYVLSFFYSFVPSLGVSIILLTCTVMLLLFPLTAKQTRSMIAMQRVQPEIKKIQQRYKSDKSPEARQKQNEEIMRFYQENKINPLSGCLPLLMQMPVFFALFSVLRSIQDHVPTGSKLFHDLCQGEATAAACSSPDFASVKFLGMDLSIAASRASGGFLDTLPYYVLIALVIFTGWYQARQTMARQKSSGVSSPMTAQMQVIGKVMPVVFGLLSLNFAAGLVVYFVTSNFWRIGQQQLVLNKYYDHGRSDTATVEVSSTDPDADAAAEAKAKAAAAARRRKKKRKR